MDTKTDLPDRGVAYVDSIRPTDSGVEARLVYPAGRSQTITFDCSLKAEDAQVPPGLRTVLAVHLKSRSSKVVCTVLGTAPGGARSIPVQLEHALALARNGAHTIFSVERVPERL